MKEVLKLRKRRTGHWVTLAGTILVGMGLLFGGTDVLADEVGSAVLSSTNSAIVGSPQETTESNQEINDKQDSAVSPNSETAINQPLAKKTSTLALDKSAVSTVSSENESTKIDENKEKSADEKGEIAASMPKVTEEKGEGLAVLAPSKENSSLANTSAFRTAEGENNSNIDEETRKRTEYFAMLNKAKLSRIEIPQGMTHIDPDAFNGNKNIKEVILPDSLLSIGNGAFAGTSIEKIILPKGLKSIGDSAFGNLEYLKEVDIPKSLKYAHNAFYGSKNLKTANFSDGIEHVPEGIMANTGLETVTLPKSVKTIGASAFASNESLKTIHLSNIERINSSAFYDCTSLADISFSPHLSYIGASAFSNTAISNLQLPNSLENIGQYAFSNTNISELTLPTSLKYLGSGAFSQINTLKKVTVNSDFEVDWDYWSTSAFSGSPITSVTIADGIKRIPIRLFERQAGITSITIPDSVEKIDHSAFLGTSLERIHLPSGIKILGNTAFGDIETLREINIPKSLTEADGVFAGSHNLSKVTLEKGLTKILSGLLSGIGITELDVPEGVEEIESSALSNNTKLTRVSLPSTLKKIGNSVFSNTGIESIVIPEGVEEIPDYAFYDNHNLKSVTLPSTIKRIGSHAFDGTTSLTTLRLPSGIQEVADYAFFNSQLETVNFPETLKKIGDSAFANNRLKQIVLPSALEQLGDESFARNLLTEVMVPSGVKILGTAFVDNNELHTVHLSEGLEEIRGANYSYRRAFYGTKINNVILPSTVKRIGNYAFYDTPDLTTFTIPTNVTSIGDSAFAHTSLETISLPVGLRTIGYGAFSGTHLTDVKLPVTVEEIGSFAFSTQTLRSVFIPSGLRKAIGIIEGEIDHNIYMRGNGAFSGASNLRTVTFENGIKTLLPSLFAGSGLENLVLPDTVETIGEDAFYSSQLKTISLGNRVKEIHSGAFQDTQLSEISIPTSVKKIGSSSFSNTKLAEVVIPDSVSEIGSAAFSSNEKLTKAKLPGNTSTIPERLFENTGLSSIVLPESVSNIERSAFENTKLTDVALPSKLTTLGYRAFANIETLESAYIPKSLESSDFAFYGDKKLSKVIVEKGRTKIPATLLNNTGIKEFVVDEGIEVIGSHAFSDNSQLEKVTLPNTLKAIDHEAFMSTGLKSIIIPNSVERLDVGVFANNSQLTQATLSEKLSFIPNRAFENSSLVEIALPESVTHVGDSAFYRNHLKKIVFPAALERIGESAFNHNDIEELKLPKSLRRLSNSAFSNNYNLRTVYIASNLENAQYDNTSPFRDTEKEEGRGIFKDPTNIFVNIEKGVTKIPSYLFDGADRVVSVTIPEGVEEIGAYAFNKTSIPGPSLDDPLFPSTLKRLGEFAFGNNHHLKRINLPKGLEVADRAFDGSHKLNVMRATDDTKIPDGMLSNTGVSTFVIPEGVREIGKYALKDNDRIAANPFVKDDSRPGLTEVMLPTTLEKIGAKAFENTSLTYVDIPDSVGNIEIGAFRFSSDLESVKLPAGLTELTAAVFEGNTKLKQLILPDKVAKIDSNAFVNMPALEKVYLPDSVKVIGENLYHNPNTTFLVNVGSFAEKYIKENNAKYPKYHKEYPERYIKYEIATDDYRNFNKTIVVKEKTSLKVASQSLKQSGKLAVRLDYALNTSGRTIANKEIRLILPEGGLFDHTVLQNGQRVAAENIEITKNILTLKNIVDVGKIELTVKSTRDELTKLDVTAQVVYQEYGTKKSERLGYIQEDMPFLKVDAPEYTPTTSVAVSGKTTPDSKIRIDVVHHTRRSFSTTSLKDGSFSLNIDLYENREMKSKEIYVIYVTNETAGIEKSQIISYQDGVPKLKSFIVKHNGVTVNLTDGKINENIIFKPGEKFEFDAQLENAEGVDVLLVKSSRNGVEKIINLAKDSSGHFTNRVNKDYYFSNDKEFIPKDFVVVAEGISDNKFSFDRDGDGWSDLTEMSTDPKDTGVSNLDPHVWNVELRDLAIFATLSYANGEDLEKIFREKTPVDLSKVAGVSEKVSGLNLEQTDRRLFENWEHVVSLEDIYDDSDRHNFHSNVSVFTDLENKNVVVAFRGTDETKLEPWNKNDELNADLAIVDNTTKVDDIARLQIIKIIQKIGQRYPDFENLYITGHSLGGYEAYHAADEILRNSDLLMYRDKLKGVISFNSPGVHQDDKDVIDRLSKLNNQKKIPVTIYYIKEKKSINTDIVAGEMVTLGGGGNSNTKHISWVPLSTKYRTLKDKDSFLKSYSHDMASFFYHFSQGSRHSKDKFIETLNDYPNIYKVRHILNIPESPNYVIDPSGTVVNSVTTKPISGVTATVYYKDKDGKEQIWKAVDYSQLNPVLTNVNGQFAWDVPEGLWKVKVAKEGYEASESDWLPVPPPQTGIDFHLKPKTYSLSFNLNGGTLESGTLTHYQTDVEVALPKATKKDYYLVGWYDNPDFAGGKYNTTLFDKVGDKVLWAKWGLEKETKIHTETRILKTDKVVYQEDPALESEQTREVAAVDGKVVVEITETYVRGQLLSTTEKELSRVEPIAKVIYKGSKVAVTEIPAVAPIEPALPEAIVETKLSRETRIFTVDTVIYLDDDTLPLGQIREVAALPGYLVIEVKEIYVNGQLVARTETELSRTEAVGKKIYRGNQVVIAERTSIDQLNHSSAHATLPNTGEKEEIIMQMLGLLALTGAGYIAYSKKKQLAREKVE